jgi:hypothetical protein
MSRAVAILLACVPALAKANGRPPLSNGVFFKPGDPDAIYVATTFGLLVSPDTCHFYWLCENAIGYGGEFDPVYAVTPSGAILAGTFHGMRVTRDGGCSFSTATAELAANDPGNLSLSYIDAVEVGPTGEVWVGTAQTASPNAVYRSTDDAVTFAARGALPSTMWFQSIKVAPSDPMRVYVTAFQISMGGGPPTPHFFRSDDAGETWTEQPLAGVQFANSPQIMVRAIDPTNENTVYAITPGSNASTGDRVYRSADGGATFQEVLATPHATSNVIVRADHRVVVATRFDPSYASDDGISFHELVGAPQLACLGERGGVLFGCANDYDANHMALASSADATSWDRVLQFEYISGPLECPPGTIEHDTCEDQMWKTFADQLGISDPSTCSSGPDALTDPPPVEAPPRKSGGCCDAAQEPPLLEIVLAAGLMATRRRRAGLLNAGR